MKRSMMLFASITLAGTVLVACGNDSENASNTNEQTQEESSNSNNNTEENASSDMSVEESDSVKQIEAYKAITEELNKMKEDKEVDWEMVDATYSDELKSAVNETSNEIDQFITTGIEAGKSGELDMNVARQMIDKGTQSYFYQKQKSLHAAVIEAKDAGEDEKAMLHFNEIKKLAENVFIPTAEKRDSYYELEGDSSIVQNINNGLDAQEEALNNGEMDNFAVYKQVTDKSTYKSYYLAANSYAEKIDQAVQDGETEDLKIMQAEALGFYQAIQGSLSGGDEEAANKLSELFNISETDPSTIKSDEVSTLFTKAFMGKIMSYHEKVAAMADEGKLTDGREAAMEANVFMKAIEKPLMETLGEEETKGLYTKGQEWFEAISNDKADEAAKLSDEIVSTLKSVVE
ncbi:hypothetical protein [Alkalihalobacillus sp. CinArs1]|uniref:hypothetical protein n=1 Tax=Alkalihalobacillus sp. CinArs1 TaxID=2995314 RepID=UPI0022DD3724|nr:hypothetical protein [Alkalihalobacillus sp. CinArs1]